MNKKITFRDMESTVLLEEHVHEQLAKVERFLLSERSPINIEVLLTAHKQHAHHEVEVRLHCPDYHFRAHAEGNDMYMVINEAIDRLYTELRRAKKKWIDTRKRG
jgi:ribosomal subunit interface protein